MASFSEVKTVDMVEVTAANTIQVRETLTVIEMVRNIHVHFSVMF